MLFFPAFIYLLDDGLLYRVSVPLLMGFVPTLTQTHHRGYKFMNYGIFVTFSYLYHPSPVSGSFACVGLLTSIWNPDWTLSASLARSLPTYTHTVSSNSKNICQAQCTQTHTHTVLPENHFKHFIERVFWMKWTILQFQQQNAFIQWHNADWRWTIFSLSLSLLHTHLLFHFIVVVSFVQKSGYLASRLEFCHSIEKHKHFKYE